MREEFWLDLVSPRLYSLLLHHGPYRRIDIGLPHLLPISELFRNIIDFRSTFTATHSTDVATAAAALSHHFGLTEMEIDLMEVAGNLHDLGKLVVPTHVLNKNGKLTKEEFALMRQHTYFTYSILNTIGGIQPVAEWAAFHHERLDGSGYLFISMPRSSIQAPAFWQSPMCSRPWLRIDPIEKAWIEANCYKS